ncbi:hypothetical protein I5G72_gp71 [Mycobacterium phage Collard]|uniref:Uncharacterized protein n=1 Tax=Mycobacterium phage Collard TaxID=2301704 RepID=A0A385DXB7_9CAUD|nr:hypothetical protein I5G72_gp71 [Mycobacterium phage Collard]AXQ63205.1 hypothetical protein SEA_COLLARD_28 [Mycobacterium phage Collard]UEM46422.1 hypothetical protein SEA_INVICTUSMANEO_28 [Mycobacterium phage InvictusManeo]
MSEYQAAHRRACSAAITALGNRIGLFTGATRVGTVSGDTTWGTPADINEAVDPRLPVSGSNPVVDKAQVTGSTVTITVPGGTVADGAVIDRYGVFNGTTLLRTEALPVSLTVNDGSQQVQVDVTPVFKYRGE